MQVHWAGCEIAAWGYFRGSGGRGVFGAGFDSNLGWPDAIRATGSTLAAMLSVSNLGKQPSKIRQASSNP
jgi:hypothetical protein